MAKCMYLHQPTSPHIQVDPLIRTTYTNFYLQPVVVKEQKFHKYYVLLDPACICLATAVQHVFR